MSKTPLNKGHRQMDNVNNRCEFRTFRDPFQEQRSQGTEGNKGQKSTPLRDQACPLERDERWLSNFVRSLAMNGTCAATTLQRLPHSSFEGSQLWRSLMECCFGTFLRSNDEAFGLVLTFDFHAHRWEIVRKVMTLNRLAANFSEPSQEGFFDVLSALVFLEEKS